MNLHESNADIPKNEHVSKDFLNKLAKTSKLYNRKKILEKYQQAWGEKQIH